MSRIIPYNDFLQLPGEVEIVVKAIEGGQAAIVRVIQT